MSYANIGIHHRDVEYRSSYSWIDIAKLKIAGDNSSIKYKLKTIVRRLYVAQYAVLPNGSATRSQIWQDPQKTP